MEHTKGNWTYQEVYDNQGYKIITTHPDYEKIIGHVASVDVNQQEANANAKLIAAAPELLEALKEISRALQSDTLGEVNIMEIADQAIKNAES